jgi:hypothetical protein
MTFSSPVLVLALPHRARMVHRLLSPRKSFLVDAPPRLSLLPRPLLPFRLRHRRFPSFLDVVAPSPSCVMRLHLHRYACLRHLHGDRQNDRPGTDSKVFDVMARYQIALVSIANDFFQAVSVLSVQYSPYQNMRRTIMRRGETLMPRLI